MDHLWIVITIITAFLQAVRTAAQKNLNRHLSTMAVTFVRSLFGLPVIVGLLAIVLVVEGGGWPRRADAWFYFMCAIGAVGQMLATALLVHLFTLRNFAVSLVLTKSELIFLAIIGAVFFSERLSVAGWIALLLTLAGVVMIALGRAQPGKASDRRSAWLETLVGRATQIGLLSGLLFAICALGMREATLHLAEGSAFYRGGWTVLTVNIMQALMQAAWFAFREPELWRKLGPHLRSCMFIGAASGTGSFGWMVAFGMQNASYVRAVGQVEIVFTLLLSWFYFRETIGRRELAGIVAILAGVLLFRLYS